MSHNLAEIFELLVEDDAPVGFRGVGRAAPWSSEGRRSGSLAVRSPPGNQHVIWRRHPGSSAWRGAYVTGDIGAPRRAPVTRR